MSILTNAPQPEFIPTYDGSNQSTHPSVQQFDTPWNGYRYWMAMTPYPFNYDGLEDPSILVSNDTKSWIVPSGLTNPLTQAPKTGHNCDVDLVYNKDFNELWLYYVEADDLVQSWVKLMRSKDGIHWTKPEIVLHDPIQKYSILSPCIQRLRNGTWRMWYVDTGNTGYQNQSNQVRSRTSEDGIHWSAEDTCEDLLQPGYQIWHLTIWRDPVDDTLHAIYPAYPNGTNCDYCKLFYAIKELNQSWKTFSIPLMEPGEDGRWDDFCLYRTAFLLNRDNDTLRVWYSAKRKSDATWGIGYTEEKYSIVLRNIWL